MAVVREAPARSWAGSLVAITWSAGLVGWLFLRFAPLGYDPTDDGYVLSQTRRILLGQVPHRDLVSPRPLGSAFLHVIDLLVPLPLFEASRLVAIIEVVAYSLLLAWLIYGRPPRTWGILPALGAVGSVLVNLNIFPLMAWYTIDGLTLIAAGAVLLEVGLGHERPRLTCLGLLCLGTSVVVKQSFLPAPALGIVRLAWGTGHLGRRERWWRLAAASALLALPSLAYLALVAGGGGLGALRTQLGSTAPTYGLALIAVARLDPGFRELLETVLALLVGVRVGRWAARALGDGASKRLKLLVALGQLALSAWLTALVLRIPLDSRFGLAKGPGLMSFHHWAWGSRLFWLLPVVVFVRGVVDHVVDGTALLLFAVAWMCALSWGTPMPNLVAGSIALLVVHRTWHGCELPRGGAKLLALPLAVAAMVVLVLLARVFTEARDGAPYYDSPVTELTAPLRSVSPAFGRIRANPTTARYLEELAACVARHPARFVAVLPDNAGLYPVLRLDNPFPTDWMYPPEVTGSEDRILDVAESLERQGDYLVLFQTFSAFALSWSADAPPATLTSAPFDYRTSLGAGILARLHGERVACGWFTGAYSPRRAAPPSQD